MLAILVVDNNQVIDSIILVSTTVIKKYTVLLLANKVKIYTMTGKNKYVWSKRQNRR